MIHSCLVCERLCVTKLCVTRLCVKERGRERVCVKDCVWQSCLEAEAAERRRSGGEDTEPKTRTPHKDVGNNAVFSFVWQRRFGTCVSVGFWFQKVFGARCLFLCYCVLFSLSWPAGAAAGCCCRVPLQGVAGGFRCRIFLQGAAVRVRCAIWNLGAGVTAGVAARVLCDDWAWSTVWYNAKDQ